MCECNYNRFAELTDLPYRHGNHTSVRILLPKSLFLFKELRMMGNTKILRTRNNRKVTTKIKIAEECKIYVTKIKWNFNMPWANNVH